ncbi:hypothetical protein [Microbispora bryophytorum]|uniref:DUF2069 domain-containing protein n=1 Tax=Microbispora bryophytorum subsp. camponoti TaxID=1677852 RepID=A0ABR8LB92_9ACTN|nr:hypothetical protein [Microbispora camponoti]MBD3147282.1 hypothetical protein [Microbispora camponoti]
MKLPVKAALVGLSIGVADVLVNHYGPEDDFSGAMWVLFTPFPLGMLLAWVTRLPLWGLVAAVAPFPMFLLYGWISATPFGVELDSWLGRLELLTTGVATYLVTALVASEMRRSGTLRGHMDAENAGKR